MMSEPLFRCLYCKENKLTYDEILQHIKNEHSNETEKCDPGYCEMYDDEIDEDVSHAQGVDFCDFCDLCGVSGDELMVHMRCCHPDELLEEWGDTDEALYGADGDDLTELSPRDIWSPRPHPSSQVFTCPMCRATFDLEDQLEYHVERHFNDSNNSSAPNKPSNKSTSNSKCSVASVLESQRQQLEERKRRMNAETASRQTSITSFLQQDLHKTPTNTSDFCPPVTSRESVNNNHQNLTNYSKNKTSRKSSGVGGQFCKNKNLRDKENIGTDDRPNKKRRMYDGYNSYERVTTSPSDSLYDNMQTCTRDVTGAIRRYYAEYGSLRNHWVSSRTDHFSSSGQSDKGYGCGYRNTQMIFSCLINSDLYKHTVFNGETRMPSVYKIQKLLEEAWRKGFDPQGAKQLESNVLGTRKFIGAAEMFAVLSSLRVRCQLVDFHAPDADGTHPRLFSWVRQYFDQRKNSFCPPIYLQYQGHSQLIVGYDESGLQGGRLVIIDPGCPSHVMARLSGGDYRDLMEEQCLRSMSQVTRKQYQLLTVLGVMQSDHEYEESKQITSVIQ